MARYVSVPTEVEAWQWTGKNFSELEEILNPNDMSGLVFIKRGRLGSGPELWVEANQSFLPLEVGEWILKDQIGYYPCKDVMFKQKYRPKEET